MYDIETASNSTSSIPRHLQYQKVYDGRKRRIRGLWVRNGRYSAQMTVKDPDTGKKEVRRIPLEVEENGAKRPVATVPEAIAAQERLKVQRVDNALPVLGRTPKFCDYVKDYLAKPTTLNKTPKTIQTETGHLNAWIKHLGETRLKDIIKPMIAEFRDKRLREKVSPRTVNLAIGALRVILREAIEDGWIQRLPMENLRALKYVARKRQLVSLADIEKICESAIEVSKNGEQFRDYIMFNYLQFCFHNTMCFLCEAVAGKGKGVNSTPLSEGSGKARRKMDAKPTPDLGVNWRGSYDKKVSRFSDEPQPKLRKI
ncbi:MAG: phage integrase SAM-like domain-containing protein [Limisphaerales bacterium]